MILFRDQERLSDMYDHEEWAEHPVGTIYYTYILFVGLNFIYIGSGISTPMECNGLTILTIASEGTTTEYSNQTRVHASISKYTNLLASCR